MKSLSEAYSFGELSLPSGYEKLNCAKRYCHSKEVIKWEATSNIIAISKIYYHGENIADKENSPYRSSLTIWEGKNYDPNKILFRQSDGWFLLDKMPGKTHSKTAFSSSKRSDGQISSWGTSFDFKPQKNSLSTRYNYFEDPKQLKESKVNFKVYNPPLLVSHETADHIPGEFTDEIKILSESGYDEQIFKSLASKEHISKPVLTNRRIFNVASENTQNIHLLAPKKFRKKYADKITNFNPSTDTLEIDTDSFGIDSSASFTAAKNKRKLKKIAKKDFDFLYDQKKGGLYFNENGADKGLGDGGIIAILKGAPDLTAGNLEFILGI